MSAVRKLAWTAFGFSLAIFLAHYLLPLPWLGWFALGALAALPVSLCLRGLNRRRWLLVFIAMAVGFGWYAVYAHRVLTPLAALDGETERTVHARVTGFPVRYDYATGLTLRLYEPGLDHLSTRVYAYDDSCGDLRPGDEITVTLRLRSAAERYGEETDTYLAQGVAAIGTVCDAPVRTGTWRWSWLYFPQRISARLQRVTAAIFPEDVFAFAQALMLGEKRPLYAQNLDIPLRDAGIMHAVAVSGMHLSFLLAALGVLFGRRRFWILLSFPFLIIFALMAGATPSVLRAVFMTMLVLLAPALERENDPATTLLTALAVMLLCQPFSAGSASLQLSFASMAGVLGLAQPIYRWLCARLSPNRDPGDRLHGLMTVLAATLGSMVATLPLGALRFGTVSLAAPITNLLVMWMLPYAFVGSYLAAVLGCLSLPLGRLAAWVVAWPLRYVLGVARVTSSLPGLRYAAAAPLTALWLVFVYLLIGALVIAHRRGATVRVLVPVCCCVITLVCVSLFSRLAGEAAPRVTALDVGQGQSLLFRDGAVSVLVDCGGTHTAQNAGDIAAQALLSERRETLDVLVLTHPHTDHVNGAERLLLQTRVRMLVLPAAADAESEPLRSILRTAERRGTEIVRLEDDTQLTLGGLRADFFVALGREQEDGCLMLRVSRGDFDVLVTGDVTIGVEDVLASEYDLSGTELLIAGHHGSRYATGDTLLTATGAGAAVISCGYNNYGHPTPETLDRLAGHGVAVWRTDEQGSVTIRME